jgi:hypothetical protein
MKKILILLFVLAQTLMGADLKHITIGSQDFSLTTETYDINDSKGEVLRLYREERNNNLTFVFSLILKDRTGACSEKSVEDGYYEINGTTVTLYSHWERRGKAYDAPYGARIQIYKLKDNYDLVRTSSKLYIETARPNYNENSGMKYLFNAPKTDEEKASLKAYVSAVERNYKGEFVYGDEAKKLIKEVEDAMTRKMKAIWN